jgi:predicted nucleotidyltransferase
VDLVEIHGLRIAVLDASSDGARNVQVFGAVARGEVTEAGDVDVLVRFDRVCSLLDQAHLIEDLRDLLGISVDVGDEGVSLIIRPSRSEQSQALVVAEVREVFDVQGRER